MARRRSSSGEGLNAWPGYVDALSTLLMVIIFVLLVFVLAQAFLSVALSGKDRTLAQLNRQMSELSDMLSLERGQSNELKLSVAQLTKDLQAATAQRDDLAKQLAAVQAQVATMTTQRDALQSQRNKLQAQLSDAQLQVQSANTRNLQLQSQLAEETSKTEAAGRQATATAGQLLDTRAQLDAAQKQLAAMKQQMAELDKTVTADKATLQARLSDLAKLSNEVAELTALRDELEKQAQDAAARAMTEQQRRAAVAAQLKDEQKFSDSARAQIALLTQQVSQLRAQLAQISADLDLAQKQGRDKDVQIANLGKKLNAALAAKVEELQKYRSEFFGKLRQVLAGRKGIHIVGDRFVFQSEVLFPVDNANLSPAGQDEINKLADTLKQIAGEIPSGVNWMLRVDGHADSQEITGGQYADNWQLSAARAINVVKLLIADGIPPQHLAATAFSSYQPIDTADTPQAFAKNRRIEFLLTDR